MWNLYFAVAYDLKHVNGFVDSYKEIRRSIYYHLRKGLDRPYESEEQLLALAHLAILVRLFFKVEATREVEVEQAWTCFAEDEELKDRT